MANLSDLIKLIGGAPYASNEDSILAALQGAVDSQGIQRETTPADSLSAIPDNISAILSGMVTPPEDMTQAGSLERLAIRGLGVPLADAPVKPAPSANELQRAILEEARANADLANTRLEKLRSISTLAPGTASFAGVGNAIVGDFNSESKGSFSKTGRGLASKASATKKDFINSGMSEVEAELRARAAATESPDKKASFIEAADKAASTASGRGADSIRKAALVQAAKSIMESKSLPQGKVAASLILKAFGFDSNEIKDFLSKLE